MDGFYRVGNVLQRGSNPVATFSDAVLAETFWDWVVRVLNDAENRAENTPAKYPDSYMYCPKCGQVTKR